MASPTSIKLDDELKARVQVLAKSQRRTPHWIMREAIAEYVAREEKREAFKQQTLEAWEAYQRDGQHLTQGETEAWLDTWGEDDDLTVPPCHK